MLNTLPREHAMTCNVDPVEPGFNKACRSLSNLFSTPMTIASREQRVVRGHFPDASAVYVVGEFNRWSTTATPMVRDRTGQWVATINDDSQSGRYCYFVWNRGERFAKVRHPEASGDQDDVADGQELVDTAVAKGGVIGGQDDEALHPALGRGVYLADGVMRARMGPSRPVHFSCVK